MLVRQEKRRDGFQPSSQNTDVPFIILLPKLMRRLDGLVRSSDKPGLFSGTPIRYSDKPDLSSDIPSGSSDKPK
jgi:hypothetical protein